MICLIAFLGNYGTQYEKTRHNTAWQFLQTLPFYNTLSWQDKFTGKYAFISRNKSDNFDKVHLLLPHTYMNLSGESVGSAVQFFKLKAEEVLIVHDEIELALGVVSLKWSGGLGGHNGLRSVKQNLGTEDFWRLRFGISKPEGKDIANYVLSPFSKSERQTLDFSFGIARGVLEKLLVAEDPHTLLPEYAKVKI